MSPRDSRRRSLRRRAAVYWLDDPARPLAAASLAGPDSADLVVVGGGYLGLWTALLAKQRDPERDVLLLEAATCGHAASGRNGGFCEASLTHGFGNGLSRWPEELDVADDRWVARTSTASSARSASSASTATS